jgi:isopropylmalate/homocitrate/citramalate synthase
MILLILDLLQKFDYEINETNIKRFLKSLQKLEEHQHQIFLEDLEKTLQYFDEQKKQQEHCFFHIEANNLFAI